MGKAVGRCLTGQIDSESIITGVAVDTGLERKAGSGQNSSRTFVWFLGSSAQGSEPGLAGQRANLHDRIGHNTPMMGTRPIANLGSIRVVRFDITSRRHLTIASGNKKNKEPSRQPVEHHSTNAEAFAGV